MASMTITRTRAKMENAVTATETEIDQQQSLQLLQTMIHGSLSSLFFARNFFPEYAFDEQIYQWSDKIHSYDDYAAGTIREDVQVAESDTAVLHVLRRDRSSRVDKFLDCLENGAFSTIQDLNLKALEVYVHPVHDRKKVLETYTYRFKYSSDGDGNRRAISGLEIEGPNDRRSTIGLTSASMIYQFRIMSEICEGLPTLTGNEQYGQDEGDKIFISMAVFYENGRPENDHPAGFERREDGPMFFGEAEDWEMRAELIPNLRFGSQTATMQITHLQHQSIGFAHNSVDKSDPLVIPPNLEFSKASHSFDKLKQTRHWHARRQSSNPERGRVNILDTRTQSIIMEDEETLSTVGESDETEDLPDMPFSSAFASSLGDGEEQVNGGLTTSMSIPDLQRTNIFGLGESLDTQSSNIPAMKKVRKMMQPERMTQGDTQTQHISSQPPSESTASLTQTVGGMEYPKADVVRCQCGSESEDDAMVKCHACNSLQHRHCYGYTDASDDRMPPDYKCYQCLLGEDEQERLEVLRKLVFTRQGMYLAQKHGMTTQDVFVANMRPRSKNGTTRGPTTTVARSIHQYLRKKGYVVQAGKGKLVAVNSGPVYDEMLKDLFDPFKDINHHYDVPATSKTLNTKGLAQQLLATQSGTMPPPMTPASHYRRLPTTTPRTDLDQRARAPDLRTPSRPSSFQRSKRDREEDTADGLPAKRRAAHDSMDGQSDSQTSILFDTSGLPSSPAASTPGGASARF